MNPNDIDEFIASLNTPLPEVLAEEDVGSVQPEVVADEDVGSVQPEVLAEEHTTAPEIVSRLRGSFCTHEPVIIRRTTNATPTPVKRRGRPTKQKATGPKKKPTGPQQTATGPKRKRGRPRKNVEIVPEVDSDGEGEIGPFCLSYPIRWLFYR